MSERILKRVGCNFITTADYYLERHYISLQNIPKLKGFYPQSPNHGFDVGPRFLH